MPYISQKAREKYDDLIVGIVEEIMSIEHEGDYSEYAFLEKLSDACCYILNKVKSGWKEDGSPRKLHDLVVELNKMGLTEMAGELNYVLSSIIWKVLDGARYWHMAYFEGLFTEFSTTSVAHATRSRRNTMINGVLKHVSYEFYRRKATPYEDKKILENGDLWACGPKVS